jgi:hypothetical protein
MWVRLGDRVDDIGGGVCGMTYLPNGIAACTQSAKPSIVLLNPSTLEIDFVFKLKHVKDPHSIAFNNGYIYIASTGTNEIYRVKLNKSGLENEELFWQYPGVSHDKDEVHLNGLAVLGDRLVATAFGEKNKDSWGSNGSVFYADTGEVLKDKLLQPHTPICKNKLLAFTESSTGTVYIYSQQKDNTLILRNKLVIGGYTRGMVIYDNELYVGVSSKRGLSKSKKLLLSNEQDTSEAQIVCINLNNQTAPSTHAFGSFAKEIYDILPVEKIEPRHTFYCVLKERIISMQQNGEIFADHITRLTQVNNNLVKENERLNRINAHLNKVIDYNGKIVETLESILNIHEQEIAQKSLELSGIKNSRGWKAISYFRKIGGRISYRLGRLCDNSIWQ